MAIVSVDGRLEDLIDLDARPERIASGFDFTEGPIWNSGDNSLIFSDIRRSTIYRWTSTDGVTTYRQGTDGANGNTFDPQGRLLSCEKDTRRVSRLNFDGRVETVASHYDGLRLSSPNDVICLANGDVIFTDPPFGLRQSDGSLAGRETPANGVYRVTAADGAVRLLTDELDAPNGLVMRDDGSELLVDDFFNHSVMAFKVAPDGSLNNGRLFASVMRGDSVGRPDGMKLDSLGNLYVAASTRDGIWVYDPTGELLGFLGFDENPSNCAWGDDDWQTLYVSTHASIFRLRMKVKGQRPNP